MADNITLPTQGTGTSTPVVATDDVAGVHYQWVKLVDGTAESTTAIASGNGVHGGALRVTVASDSTGTIACTNAGTFATQVDGAALTALQLIDNTIVAHDAAISGASGVSVIGMNARSSDPTAVATADATQALATLLGKQVTVPYALPASSWSYASAAAVTDTADDQAAAAGGAGVRNYITGVQVFNGSASVSTEVVIKDGSTVLWRGWAQAGGGGCSARFDPPLRGTANTAVNVANITTSSSTYFNLQGYTASE